jgi:hypothetical protein
MRILAAVGLMAATMLATPAMAQQVNQSTQTEADKGIKTQNSGASGFVEIRRRRASLRKRPANPIRRTLRVRARSVRTHPLNSETRRMSKECRATRADRPPSAEARS